MAINESDLIKRIREAPLNYALLKLIHHEFGNGHEILHEHGGRIWSEQEGSISLTLPLAEERKERL